MFFTIVKGRFDLVNGEQIIDHPIRWAMIGGGRGSQIGYIHRSAALRDRSFQLVAGAFDINPERGRDFGISIGVDPARCYDDYKILFAEEAKRHDGIEAVSIATPNNTHYEICKAALEAGLHVVCEKPLCFKTEEAQELVRLADDKGLIVGVTYGYSGHQMIRQAAKMIENGDLGEVRIVNMQFAHGAYNTAIEEMNPAAKWRLEPEFAGSSFVLGDIGTHTLFLAETMIPGLKIKNLMCSRQSFVKGRKLEDNAYVIMNYENGAVGTVWVSAVNCGSMHGQKIRVIGSKASIEWWDERPNQLTFEIEGEPTRVLERGASYLYPEALEEDRIGGGHPEGLFESWSNLYRRFAMAMDAVNRGDSKRLKELWYPDIHAGAEGVKWVETCVKSANQGAVWLDY